jgi:hypothetical protein
MKMPGAAGTTAFSAEVTIPKHVPNNPMKGAVAAMDARVLVIVSLGTARIGLFTKQQNEGK